MWSVLLVEDEVFVRRMLRSSMPWEAWGFQVVAEAGNGVEALERLREQPVHLVVTDIMMPRMNGVELLRQARAGGLECRFIMLSVMNDFDYVQQALEHGASNYLLKLYLSAEKLQEVLEKVDRELRQLQSAHAAARRPLYGSLWELLLGQWRAGGQVTAAETEAAAARGAPAGVELRPPGRRGLLVHVLHGRQELTQEEFLGLGVLEPAAAGQAELFHRPGHTTAFYWIPPGGSDRVMTPSLNGLLAVYGTVLPEESLLHRWEAVARRGDVLWHAGRCGVFGEEQRTALPVARVSTWELEREILHALEQQRLQACRDAIRQLWAQLAEAVQPAALMLETAERLSRLFALIAGRPAQAADAHLCCATSAGLRQWLERQAEEAVHSALEQQSGLTDHAEVNRVIRYIREHYASEITVPQLARHVLMDDKYLSGLFKRKTGRTVIHFLQEVRIEQACLLLEHTDWPVSEVGVKAGFASENYFAKIFRRMTGDTPSHYRQERRGSLPK